MLTRISSLTAGAVLFLAAPGAMAQDAASLIEAAAKAPAAILSALEAVEVPEYDPERRQEEGYVESFIAARDKARGARAELIAQLYEAAPNHDELTALLPERWEFVGQADPQRVLAETDKVLAGEAAAPLQLEASYHRASAVMMSSEFDPTQSLDAIDAFLERGPGDERGAQLLVMVASYGEKDLAARTKLYERVKKDFPESFHARQAESKLRQFAAIGKPFELTFDDAIGGEAISMQGLRGKVVVLDFWATWCGPCIAEMPEMKELYAEFQPQGVEFIGVSLDSAPDKGGLEKLKAYVAENEVPWPQYYQGNGWESEFSSSWGINSIPALFVVDQQGNLFSVDARGRLETLLPEMLGAKEE